MEIKNDKRPHWSFKRGYKTDEIAKDELAQILNYRLWVFKTGFHARHSERIGKKCK